jgi:hypothetical protein
MKCVVDLHICSYRAEAWADTNTIKHSMGKYNFAFCAVADVAEKRTSDSVQN